MGAVGVVVAMGLRKLGTVASGVISAPPCDRSVDPAKTAWATTLRSTTTITVGWAEKVPTVMESGKPTRLAKDWSMSPLVPSSLIRLSWDSSSSSPSNAKLKSLFSMNDRV